MKKIILVMFFMIVSVMAMDIEALKSGINSVKQKLPIKQENVIFADIGLDEQHKMVFYKYELNYDDKVLKVLSENIKKVQTFKLCNKPFSATLMANGWKFKFEYVLKSKKKFQIIINSLDCKTIKTK